MFQGPKTAFFGHEFWAFKKVCCLTHDTIMLEWVHDLNDQSEQLAFNVNGEKVFAKHAPRGLSVSKPVNKELFKSLISKVKAEC